MNDFTSLNLSFLTHKVDMKSSLGGGVRVKSAKLIKYLALCVVHKEHSLNDSYDFLIIITGQQLESDVTYFASRKLS